MSYVHFFLGVFFALLAGLQFWTISANTSVVISFAWPSVMFFVIMAIGNFIKSASAEISKAIRNKGKT